MKGPQHWPWYLTLVFHVLNVLALDTEAGPQYLPPEYTHVDLPEFPTEKVTTVMAPYTTNQVKEMASEKKALKADVYYALPRRLSKELENRRTNSPLWPMVPKDAESRYEDIIRRATLGTLTRSWATDEVLERGRAQSRVTSSKTRTKSPQQRGHNTRASSRGSEVPPAKTKTSGSVTVSSKVDNQAPTPSRPRPKPWAASKVRAASRAPSKSEAKPSSSKMAAGPSQKRATAVRSKSVKVRPKEDNNEDSSTMPEVSRSAYVGKCPPPVMKRVPTHTDEDEG